MWLRALGGIRGQDWGFMGPLCRLLADFPPESQAWGLFLDPRSPSRIVYTWRGRGLSKSFISRAIIGVTPFRVLITLLITYLLSPLPLQVPMISPKPVFLL